MDLIFSREHAEKLKERYTVLELETITLEQLPEPVTTWCVVPAERVIGELEMLPLSVAQHNELIQAIAENKTKTALTLCENLKGKFGGELDSFYEEIAKRVEITGSCVFVPVDHQ